MPFKLALKPAWALSAALIVMPSLALAQSAPPLAKPPLAAPEPAAPPAGEAPKAVPEADMPAPEMPLAPDEEDEDEEQAMPGDGCPFLGNKLELIV